MKYAFKLYDIESDEMIARVNFEELLPACDCMSNWRDGAKSAGSTIIKVPDTLHVMEYFDTEGITAIIEEIK